MKFPKYFYFRVKPKRHGTAVEIEDASDADVVEVVRCKDCRWHEREQPGMVYCPNTVGNWVEDDWYCKGGERKGEE